MLISFERHVKYQSKQPTCHSITGNEHSIRVNLAAKMKKYSVNNKQWLCLQRAVLRRIVEYAMDTGRR